MLTEEGVDKAERLLGVGNLYDPANMELLHCVEQALKAHTLYRLDHQYVVQDGEVIIVDDFTGRLMKGRRWSDGLHQAVEAKEGVKIEKREPDARHDHAAELFPSLRKTFRHDRYRGNGSGRVSFDLQTRCDGHSRRTCRWSARIIRT